MTVGQNFAHNVTWLTIDANGKTYYGSHAYLARVASVTTGSIRNMLGCGNRRLGVSLNTAWAIADAVCFTVPELCLKHEEFLGVPYLMERQQLFQVVARTTKDTPVRPKKGQTDLDARREQAQAAAKAARSLWYPLIIGTEDEQETALDNLLSHLGEEAA